MFDFKTRVFVFVASNGAMWDDASSDASNDDATTLGTRKSLIGELYTLLELQIGHDPNMVFQIGHLPIRYFSPQYGTNLLLIRYSNHPCDKISPIWYTMTLPLPLTLSNSYDVPLQDQPGINLLNILPPQYGTHHVLQWSPVTAI